MSGLYLLDYPVRSHTLDLIGHDRMEREFVLDGALRVRAARLTLAPSPAEVHTDWFAPTAPDRPQGWPAPYADDVWVLVVHYPLVEHGVHGPARSLADQVDMGATRLGDWSAAVRLRPDGTRLAERIRRRLRRRTT